MKFTSNAFIALELYFEPFCALLHSEGTSYRDPNKAAIST